MRDLKLIKRCLILLALVWAQIPASVLAQLCQPSPTCKMRCCVGKTIPPKAETKRTCGMCPSEAAPESVGSTKSLENQISSNTAQDSCPCKIAPRTSPAEKLATACFTGTSSCDQGIDFFLTPQRQFSTPAGLTSTSPGIVGTDSGPPIHRPSCVWLGRAPPVPVA